MGVVGHLIFFVQFLFLFLIKEIEVFFFNYFSHHTWH
jgi:hypothetical protein